MNSYLYFGLMLLLGVLNSAFDGNIWTAILIIASGALAQLDARLDCQNQLDASVEKIKLRYERMSE